MTLHVDDPEVTDDAPKAEAEESRPPSLGKRFFNLRTLLSFGLGFAASTVVYVLLGGRTTLLGGFVGALLMGYLTSYLAEFVGFVHRGNGQRMSVPRNRLLRFRLSTGIDSVQNSRPEISAG